VHQVISYQFHETGATADSNEREEEEKVMVRMLQVARAIVHNERVLEHHADFFQSKLASFKIIAPTLNLLGSDSDAIVSEALNLLITIFDEVCRWSGSAHYADTEIGQQGCSKACDEILLQQQK
jgi:hypothetical protein